MNYINNYPTLYFGSPKFRKPDEEQVQTPVGATCGWCDEDVQLGDMGTIIGNQVCHYECQMRSVAGSVGHQLGRCSCFGGTEEDPEGMTNRQAAIAAARLWDETHSH